jgi:DNA-binding CsgD family transcriptional regulator
MKDDAEGGRGPRAGQGAASWPGWRGREHEWGLVTGLLDAARAGRGGVLLIEGPAGIGKSRLLAEAGRAATDRDVGWARGDADESLRYTPLAPLTTALGEPFPTPGPGEEKISGDLRMWLVDRLRSRLEDRLSAGPMLLTLDDLQWADPTSLLALRSLVPELSSYPLVWMLARTAGGENNAADRLFPVLERAGADRITLEPLGRPAVRDVAEDLLGARPGDDVLALAADMDGNPFLLTETLRALRDEGVVEIAGEHARLSPSSTRRLPRRMQEVAHDQLAALSPRGRSLLQVAALLGRSFSLVDLADVLDEPADRLIPALREALAARIIVAVDGELTFRHDVLRQAVSDGLTGSVRHRTHHRIGDSLLRRGGSAVPAATHLMTYARPGDRHAAAGLDRAAGEVLRSSPQAAADLALRALELTDGDDPARWDRTVTAVGALTAAGRLWEAAELAEDAVDRAPDGRAPVLRHQLALVLVMNGRPAEAVAEIEKALTDPDLPEEFQADAELTWFAALVLQRDFWRGEKRAEAIVAERDRHRDGAVAGALILLAHIAWAEGRVAEGLGRFRDAADVAGRGAIGAHTTTPHLFLAACLQCMRLFDEAEAVLRRAQEEIDRTGQTLQSANLAFVRAYTRLSAGRIDDAVAEARSGLETAAELGTCGFTRLGDAALAIIALMRGDLAAADDYIEQYNVKATGNAIPWGWGVWAVARVTEARYGPQRAVDLLAAETRMWRWFLLLEPDLAAWWTRVCLAADDPARAGRVVETITLLAETNPGYPVLACSATHARGVLHGDAAALAEAAHHLDGSWAGASAAEDLGVLLGHAADRQAAVDRLDRALTGYEAVGSVRDAARVRARLRRLGARRRHWRQAERPVTGWDSLTETERSVALLVAQGLTNRQVAAHMFISPHTVKFHLSQVFRKLQVGSRVELARAAPGQPERT